jgi:hypothetical protein
MKVIFGQSAEKVSPSDSLAPAAPPSPAPALLKVADETLRRHRAAVLIPQSAPLLAGQSPPPSTVYRLDVLLVPEDRWSALPAMNTALAPIGVYLTLPAPTGQCALPRPVRIRVLPEAPPTTVDAWVALQTLRAAADSPGLESSTVARISLDHLMFGSAFPSALAMVGENLPTEGSGVDSIQASARSGYEGPRPVQLALAPMARRAVANGSRRPVVALLDSGVSPHPWFNQQVLVRTSTQQAVIAASQPSAGSDLPTADTAIMTPADGPVIDNVLVGELASHFGHSTFIAGLIRQLGPDADIQTVRVMHSDGIAYESDVLCALSSLASDVIALRAGDLSRSPVDIVSLSLGYFDESPMPGKTQIAAMIDELTSLGVMVVAAAGNHATSRPFLPAALAAQFANDPKRAPVIAVGALNPNGTIALFSDEARWVTCYADGAGLVSSFPVVARGSVTAANQVPELARESLDLDDFRAGFAVWSGSSFAVAVVVGLLSNALAPAEVPAVESTDGAIALAHAAVDALRAAHRRLGAGAPRRG